ncbi:MAG: ATP-grasp domain-containing protein [Hyphomicrobiales bacterium]
MTRHSPSPPRSLDGRDLSGLAVGVVDPNSAGAFIAKRLMERNADCVAIFTRDFEGTESVFPAIYRQTDPDFIAKLDRVGLNAVIPGAESGVRLAEELASRFGLPGNDPKTTDKRRNKTRMMAVVQANGIEICAQRRCDSVRACLAWAEKVGFPVVVKPEASSGSDLVRICHDRRCLERHAAFILEHGDKYANNTGGVLVQEFMRGVEHTVDGIMSAAGLTVFAVGRYRKLDREGAMIYDRIDFHAPNDPAIDPRIIAYCETVARAVDIEVGAVHAEIMLTASGPLLVEIAARAHGGIGACVIDSNIQPSFLDALIDASLPSRQRGRDPLTIRKIRAASVCFLGNERCGLLSDIPGRKVIESLPSFVKACWLVRRGEAIAETVDLVTCPAMIELSHDNPAIVETDIARIRDLERQNLIFTMEDMKR